MNITERFSEVLSSIEFQLARSLPVFDKGKEIIFFYKTDEINITEYRITEIRYVVIRDIRSGSIKIKKAAEIIPDVILDSVVNSVNTHTMSVGEELLAEDEYLSQYEKLFGEITSNQIPTGKEVKKLSHSFSQLTKGTNLKGLYAYLGEDLLKTISAY